MTNQEILKAAMRQSAIDLHCDEGDFLLRKNKVVLSTADPAARKYLELPFSCHLASYGNNIVASVQEQHRDIVTRYIEQYPAEHCFETPHMHVLNDALQEEGLRICFMAEYFLPDINLLKKQECGFELRVLHREDFAEES